MAKREIPLFVFDLTRDHNLGECDFVSCTDMDNAFIAKIDYVTNADDVVTDTLRIGNKKNGVSIRLEIKRITGKNPDNGAIRTLLKKAEELYVKRHLKIVNTDSPSDEDMINFLNLMISGNKKNISAAGSNVNERKIITASLNMLESIRDRIKK
jgi:hypothetical protein